MLVSGRVLLIGFGYTLHPASQSPPGWHCDITFFRLGNPELNLHCCHCLFGGWGGRSNVSQLRKVCKNYLQKHFNKDEMMWDVTTQNLTCPLERDHMIKRKNHVPTINFGRCVCFRECTWKIFAKLCCILLEYNWSKSLQERCPMCDVSTVHSEHPEAIGMVWF